MNQTEAFAECHCTLGCRHHHVPARILVASVADGPKEMPFSDGAFNTVTGRRFTGDESIIISVHLFKSGHMVAR